MGTAVISHITQLMMLRHGLQQSARPSSSRLLQLPCRFSFLLIPAQSCLAAASPFLFLPTLNLNRPCSCWFKAVAQFGRAFGRAPCASTINK